MIQESNSFKKLVFNVTKIAAPVGGFLGTVADIFKPFAPFAPFLFALSVVVFIYFTLLKVRPKIKLEGRDLALESRHAHIAGFSMVVAFVMLIIWGISAQYPDEGFVAGNMDGVKNLQIRLMNTMDDVVENQQDIIKSQEKISSSVEKITEIIRGESEIRNMSSTEDFSVVDDINLDTKDSDKITIAITYFDNGNKNQKMDPLRKGLADMLISDLSNVKMLRIVEREKLEQVLAELNLSNTKEFDIATRQKLGQLLGAENIIFGSYFEMMGQIRIDARMVHTETGEIIKAEGVNGDKAAFMTLEKTLVWKIINNLDVRIDEKERADIARSESGSYETISAYSDALELYDQGQIDEALKRLRQIANNDPSFGYANLMIERVENL